MTYLLRIFSVITLISGISASFAATVTDVAKFNPHNFAVKRSQGLLGYPQLHNRNNPSNQSHSAPDQYDELRVVSRIIDQAHQITHTTYQQYYHGIPIFGKQVVTHTASSTSGTTAATDAMNGRYVINLASEHLDAKPAITSEAAILAVRQQLSRITPLSEVQDTHAQLVWFIGDDNKSTLAYHVSLSAKQEQHPRRVHAIVSASDHQLLKMWDSIGHARNIEAAGYGGNEKIGRTEYGKRQGYLPVTIGNNNKCHFENEHVRLIDLQHQTSGNNKTLQYACNPPFFFHEDRKEYGAFSIANDAYYFGNIVSRMYRNWYQTQPLNSKITLRIHFDQDYGNAHFDESTNTMNFGDGDDMFYPLVSLDITSHEISHGFTAQHANLIYSDESGAINESFSDMAGKAAEYFEKGSVNWGIGSDIVKRGMGNQCPDGTRDALRCMDDPTVDEFEGGIGSIAHTKHYKRLQATAKRKAHKFIADEIYFRNLPVQLGWLTTPPTNLSPHQLEILDYLRALESDLSQSAIVHTASGVFNKAFHLLATTPGWNVRKAFHVMLYANQYGYWTSDSRFSDAALGAVRVASVLQYDEQAVINAFRQVGIDCSKTACNSNYGD